VRTHQVGIVAIISLTASAYSVNPFLDAKDDTPVFAKFRGTEWGDNSDGGGIALTARLITTRVARMLWGAIFKIEFNDLKSRAPKPRKIEPEYFVVTDDRIALLNEEHIDMAIQRISALDTPPEFEPGDIYGITRSTFSHEDGLWKTTIEVKGDFCIYQASHPSGHFKHVVWKKGIGLIEYSMGYGARADGFRLKRTTPKKP
jgi:hypothetical protein